MSNKIINAPRRRERGPRSGLGYLVLALTVFLGVLALVHILVKNKTHAIGREQKVVELEIAALTAKARTLDVSIEEALSRKNITDKLIARRSKLKAILPENVVRLSMASQGQ